MTSGEPEVEQEEDDGNPDYEDVEDAEGDTIDIEDEAQIHEEHFLLENLYKRRVKAIPDLK